jgi:hypothetical protein
MDTSRLAARGRERVESLFTSTATVFTTGAPVTDPNTGQVSRTATTIWSGPCRVRPAQTGLTALSEALGGTELFRFDYRVSIPFDVDTVFEGMRVTITGSPDPGLLGLTMEIHRVDRGDNITARRLICQRVG